MQSIVVDSGPLIALFDRSDHFHQQALAFLKNNHMPLVTNIAVITEVTHVLGFSTQAQLDFLHWVQKALAIDTETARDLPEVTTLLEKYADLPADLADASLVCLCARLKTRNVASVDNDFTVYRLPGRKSFQNHFFS